jgi:plasmid stabilization system protein ParE
MMSLATLKENPRRWARVLGAGSGGTEVTQLTYRRRHGRYRILFTISGDTVEVLRVRHGARAPLRSWRQST